MQTTQKTVLAPLTLTYDMELAMLGLDPFQPEYAHARANQTRMELNLLASLDWATMDSTPGESDITAWMVGVEILAAELAIDNHGLK